MHVLGYLQAISKMKLNVVHVFVALLATFCAASASEDAYDVFEAAIAAAQSGNVAKSVALFNRVLAPPLVNQLPPAHRAQVHYNLGFTLQQAGRCGDAMPQFDAALRIAPDLEQANIKAAWCAKEMGAMNVAVGYLRAAIQRNKNAHPNLYMYLGDMHNNIKRFDEAIQTYLVGLQRARASNIQDLAAKIMVAIGDAHANIQNTTGAIHYYTQAQRITPNNAELAASLLHSRLQTCDWHAYEADIKRAISTALQTVKREAQVSPLTPYHCLFIEMEEQTRHVLAGSVLHALTQSVATNDKAAEFTPEKSMEAPFPRKLRIGYISRRFEDYPGTQLMLSLFTEHDRSRVEVHCFASGPDDKSFERQTVARTCDSFEDVSMLSAADTAKNISVHDIDVLIDYDGLHDFNNVRTFAFRPAPVQITFLGFASTTGAPRTRTFTAHFQNKKASVNNPIDYIVSDPILSPIDFRHDLPTENILMMKHTYQPQDPRQAFSEAPPTSIIDASGALHEEFAALRQRLRPQEKLSWLTSNVTQRTSPKWDYAVACEADCDFTGLHASPSQGAPLPEPLVYVSFNRWSKIDPLLWHSWMNVLQRTPHALLWVYGGGPEPCVTVNVSSIPSACRNDAAHRENLWLEAAKHGVHPSRIVFAGRADRGAHLLRHFAADIALDSRIYGAHTTTADAIFSGTPTVTLLSCSFAARVGASLASATSDTYASVGKTYSLLEYEDVAAMLGADGVHFVLRNETFKLLRETVSQYGEYGVRSNPQSENPATAIFNAHEFARDLEVRARAAYELQGLQLAPHHIV